MPRLGSTRNPKHSLHAASGLGVVYFGGHPIYTGPWGSEEGVAKYHRLIGEWNARGRKGIPGRKEKSSIPTIAALVRRYDGEVASRFMKRGQSTSYGRGIRRALKRLTTLYGSLPADQFGLDEYLTVRGLWAAMTEDGVPLFSKQTISVYSRSIVKMFAWGVSRKLVPWSDWMGQGVLKEVQPRSGRKNRKITPAPVDAVTAILGEVRPVIAAMIRLQLATAMRPCEVCAMRPVDLDRSSKVWVYTVQPEWNKTEHLEIVRKVPIGPKAQEILKPWLEGCPENLEVFRRRCGKKHDPDSHYGKVIKFACDKLGVKMTANQLRHSRLTEIRRSHGLEGAAAVAGHSDVETTKIYAEKDWDLAAKVAEATG